MVRFVLLEASAIATRGTLKSLINSGSILSSESVSALKTIPIATFSPLTGYITVQNPKFVPFWPKLVSGKLRQVKGCWLLSN
jgi:hypothetical protein